MTYIPAAAPDIDMIDPGRWREVDVTRWHLLAVDSDPRDRNRRHDTAR